MIELLGLLLAILGLAPDDRGHTWGQHPKYLIHDRDRVYGADFVTRVAGLGIEGIHTPLRAPRANATAEGVVQSWGPECLDHILPLSEAHARWCWPSS